jgi:hypothetical protein
MVSQMDGWAVGTEGGVTDDLESWASIFHWDGESWSPYLHSGIPRLFSVAMA